MELLLDISRKSFSVGRPFERKVDDNGVQKLDRETRLPLFIAQLIVMDERGADTIMVTIAHESAGGGALIYQGSQCPPVPLATDVTGGAHSTSSAASRSGDLLTP
jgi:hypothetical protein